MTQPRRPASTSRPFSVDDDAHDPVILYTIPAGARLVLTRPSVYRAHRRRAARRHAGRQAGGQEHRRARRGRARAHREPDERPALQAHAVRAPGALRRGHAGDRGGDRRGGGHPGRPGRLLLRHQGRLGRGVARRYQPGGGQGRHARPRRQLRRGGAPQGRAAQRHGAHDDAGPRPQARQGGLRRAAQEPAAARDHRRTRPAATSISAARCSSIAATRRSGSCGG